VISISKRRLPSLRVAIPLGLIASFAITATGAAAVPTTVVKPSSMNSWQVVDDNAHGGTISFVSGPDTAPVGNGSARFELTASNQGMLLGVGRTSQLSSITTLKYSTYRSSADANNNLAPSLQLTWDNDTTDADNAYKGRLVYEPVYAQGNGAVLQNTWQEWDAMSGAGWWATNGTFAATCSTGAPCTWAQVTAAWPNAGFHAGYGGPGFKAGSGIGSFDANVDNFQISDSAGANVYNFDAETQCSNNCYVDAATGSDAFGGDTAGSAKATIQAAVSQVSAGGTVHVAAGTYSEQVVANHNMTIDGAGAGSTKIKAPASLVASADPGRFAVVEIKSGADVEMSDLNVSGPGPSGCGSLHYGILVTGAAHLDAHDMSITDIRDSSFSGCQNGNGIQVGRQAISQTGTADIDNVTVTGYQKTGFIVDNFGSWMHVTDSTVTGAGATSTIAQNGIQISRGATASVTDSAISGNVYTGTGADSTDILLYQAGNNVSITGNTLSASDIGIDVAGGSIGTGFAAHRNSIHGNGTGVSNDIGGSVNAECNWWGAANGPSAVASGSGDKVSASVDYEPWLESSDLTGDCSGVSLRGVLTPGAHNFGNQGVNTTSAPSTFTFTNDGYDTLNVTDVSLAGTNLGQFEIDTNNCDAAALGHGESCTIDLVFEPNSTGSKTARLEVDSNDPNTPTAVSNLTGNGTTVVATNGTITIVLDGRPDGSQSFGFTGALGAFSLTDDGASTNTAQFSRPAGTYKVQAAKVNGWSLKSLSCDKPETINKSKRTVIINLTSGQNVTCAYTETQRLPDGSIASTSGGPFSGVGIYSGTAQPSQTQNQAIAVGQTKSFYVHLTNNGQDSDSFKVYSTLTGSTKFAVKFFVGATDVTARVNAGTYSTTLNAGQTATIQVQVKAVAGTPATATRNIDLTMKSKSSTAKDVVRGHVTRV